MSSLQLKTLFAVLAAGSVLAPGSYGQGTIIHIVPEEPVNMFGISGLPWIRDFDLDGDGIQDYQFDNDGAVVYVSPLGNNRQVAYPTGGRDLGSRLTPLFEGELIGTSLDPMLGQWVDRNSPNWWWSSSISYQFNVGGGGPFYGRIAYMGIDFVAADGWRHFGWVKIDNSSHVAGGLLVEWAWAATPGVAILAGARPVVVLQAPPEIVRPGHLRLRWQTDVGIAYQIQSKENLAAPLWTNLDFVIVATTTNAAVDVPIVGTTKFFRVVEAD